MEAVPPKRFTSIFMAAELPASRAGSCWTARLALTTVCWRRSCEQQDAQSITANTLYGGPELALGVCVGYLYCQRGNENALWIVWRGKKRKQFRPETERAFYVFIVNLLMKTCVLRSSDNTCLKRKLQREFLFPIHVKLKYRGKRHIVDVAAK